MSNITTELICDFLNLLNANRILMKINNLGDYIYEIRDSKGQGWKGPKVQAWGEACETILRLLKKYESTFLANKE